MALIGTISPTDTAWYEFFLRDPRPEVNFWTPSDRRRFNAPEFSPFLFKLKAPHNAICGFGYFARWATLPDWLAWEAFGEGNGVPSLQVLRARIGTLRQKIGYDPEGTQGGIGCIIVVQPVWFDQEHWVAQPADWPRTTVTGKSYDLTVGEGKRVWDACQLNAATLSPALQPQLVAETPVARYGSPVLVTPRIGQGTFRVAVTDAYGRSCAATGEHSLPALEAAHIRAYGDDGPHAVANGILFRADIHRLFDQGYMTVTPAHRIEVSSRLRDEFSNGHSYYPLHGSVLRLPSDPSQRPARAYIDWHNEHVYRG